MKYWPGVPTFAPRGLRTHICQVPITAANRKAPNATQKCARQSRSTLRTGNPPVRVRLELVIWKHLPGRPYLALPPPTTTLAAYQTLVRPGKLGVALGHAARDHH